MDSGGKAEKGKEEENNMTWWWKVVSKWCHKKNLKKQADMDQTAEKTWKKQVEKFPTHPSDVMKRQHQNPLEAVSLTRLNTQLLP